MQAIIPTTQIVKMDNLGLILLTTKKASVVNIKTPTKMIFILLNGETTSKAKEMKQIITKEMKLIMAKIWFVKVREKYFSNVFLTFMAFFPLSKFNRTNNYNQCKHRNNTCKSRKWIEK